MSLAALALALAAPVVWSKPPVSTDQFESHPAFDPRTGDLWFVRSTPEFRGWRIKVSHCGSFPSISPCARKRDPLRCYSTDARWESLVAEVAAPGQHHCGSRRLDRCDHLVVAP